MKVALIQTDIAWNDPLENIRRSERLAHEALDAGSQALIFPEMFTCGFSMPTGSLAKECELAGREFLVRLATKSRVYTIGSIPEVANDGHLYNLALTVSPDGSTSSYRKIHLFSYGDETALYAAGSAASSSALSDGNTAPLRCTVFICYDLRFADLFVTQAERTDLFVVVANWPASRREHWLTLLRARAIETQSFVAGVNRVGSGGGLTYSGDSALFAPDGTDLGILSDHAAVLCASIEPSAVSNWRNTFPALRDRRDDIYSTLRAR